MNHNNKIFRGNLNQDEIIQERRGWFIGHFADTPLKTQNFEVKWGKHNKGEKKDSVGANEVAKSVWLLISGKVRITFPEEQSSLILEKEGDYVFYDQAVPHTWEIVEDCVSLTLRWPSLPNDQIDARR